MKEKSFGEIKEEIKILSDGVEKIVPENGLEEKIIKSRKNKKPLIAKLGVDPS